MNVKERLKLLNSIKLANITIDTMDSILAYNTKENIKILDKLGVHDKDISKYRLQEDSKYLDISELAYSLSDYHCKNYGFCKVISSDITSATIITATNGVEDINLKIC